MMCLFKDLGYVTRPMSDIPTLPGIGVERLQVDIHWLQLIKDSTTYAVLGLGQATNALRHFRCHWPTQDGSEKFLFENRPLIGLFCENRKT